MDVFWNTVYETFAIIHVSKWNRIAPRIEAKSRSFKSSLPLANEIGSLDYCQITTFESSGSLNLPITTDAELRSSFRRVIQLPSSDRLASSYQRPTRLSTQINYPLATRAGRSAHLPHTHEFASLANQRMNHTVPTFSSLPHRSDTAWHAEST